MSESSLEQKISDAIHTYVDAFAKKDLDAILNLYHENAVVEDPVGSEPHRGMAAITAFYAAPVQHVDIRLQLEGQIRIASNNEAAFAFTGEMHTEQGVMIINSIDHMIFNEEGKIMSMRAFWGPSNMTMKPDA